MKKTRKLLALVLALMMSFSCMAMPAMAAGDEEIMPRRPMGVCPYCDRACELQDLPGMIWYEDGCDKTPWPHSHECYFKDSYTCPNHGTFYGPAVETPC